MERDAQVALTVRQTEKLYCKTELNYSAISKPAYGIAKA